MRKHLIAWAKWIWLLSVLLVGCILTIRHWPDIVAMLTGLSPTMLAASVALTAFAKMFLAENARIAADRNGIKLRFSEAARLYNLSQMGKYIPGSIWQFVGRAAAYRQKGAGYGPIRDSLLVESLWIVAGALVVGLALTGPRLMEVIAASLTPTLAWWLGGMSAIGLIVIIAVAFWRRTMALRYFHLAMPSVRVLVVQACIWLLLGLAFWVLARASGLDVSPFFAIGLFAAGYALGFVVPFAPAGLGIRDAILTVGLLPYVPAGQAMVVTILARLVYLLVDFGLVLIQETIFQAFDRRATTHRG